MSGASEFGKDLGLMLEAVVTGRAVGMGREEWAKFAHDRELARSVMQLIRGELTLIPAKPKKLLEFVRTAVTTFTGKFIAKEKFVRDTGRKAKVKISYLSDNFTSWFLNGDGKTEDPISEHTLCYHKLRQSSVDGPIIAELGGEAKAETTLSEMFSLMEKRGKGEAGVLLNNGYANIFYIKDNAGVLRAVYVRWDGVGWLVGASGVSDPYGWRGGRQVFSRNSVLEPSEPSAPAA